MFDLATCLEQQFADSFRKISRIPAAMFAGVEEHFRLITQQGPDLFVRKQLLGLFEVIALDHKSVIEIGNPHLYIRVVSRVVIFETALAEDGENEAVFVHKRSAQTGVSRI